MRLFSDFSELDRCRAECQATSGNGQFSVLSWLALSLLLLGRHRSFAGETEVRFANVSAESGIRFVHTDGSSGERYLMEAMASGLATFDYDRDGELDIYFLNGAPLGVANVKDAPRDALYRNEGGLRFTDVTEQSGLGDPGFGLGVAIADYDEDGFSDVLVSNFGPKALYHNNGDGTFTETTAAAGLADGIRVGAGVTFLDIEGDGDLDLYVANYIKFNYAIHKPTLFRGRKIYPGPLQLQPEFHQLFRNRGDGTFDDISQWAGIAQKPSWGMGTVAADFDDDGDCDIFVANDSDRNFLFENDGVGSFREVGTQAGVAYDYQGKSLGSMGVDVGDYNNDGRLDIFHTSYQKQLTVLYQNLGGGSFQDVTPRTGAGVGTFQRVNWGAGLVDFDNDGDRDVFIVNGHIHDNLDDFDDNTSYRQTNQVLENQNGRQFVDVSKAAGVGLRAEHSGRGACFEDFDDDGDVDAVILNSRSRPTLLENRSTNARGSIEIELVGKRANRDGVGARVWVKSQGSSQVAEVHSGRGYQSHFGSRLHFGLARSTNVVQIEVRWTGGNRDFIRDVPVGSIIQIHEGGRNHLRGK